MSELSVETSGPADINEVLRQAGIALEGRVVGLWEASPSGAVVPVATGPGRRLPPTAVAEMNEALGLWRVERAAGRRWIACRLDLGRWCIAPVRGAPATPPDQVERRRRERMTLELAALCLGTLDGLGAQMARHRLVEEALRRSSREMEDFFERAPIALHWIGPDGRILRANRAALELLGYDLADYLGRHVAGFHTDPELIENLLERMADGETVHNLETTLRHRDGSLRHVLISSNARFDEQGRFLHTRCFTRDITEWKRAEAQLHHGALHDRLTNLPNRTLFLERVAQGFQRRDREPGFGFAVMFLDCDNFKIVNDSLGHRAGDELLVKLARRLEGNTRPGDMVARLSGDEFVLFLEDVVDVLDAARVAERVQLQFIEPFTVEGQELYITASIGIALGTAGYLRPEDLLRDADIAMYRAKSHGCSRYEVFDPAMRDRALHRLSLETGLRQALDRDEFRLAYQPILDLRTGRLEGFEALLRWEHPQRGTVAPGEFIPTAEELGLIVPLGAWVLREACRQARAWQTGHPRPDPIKISVNLSARQVGHDGLTEHVTAALWESGLAPDHLRLEITENVLLEGIEGVGARLERLRGLDVKLHMDDFGTGYSSLAYLRRFPLDALKIDRSFVRRLGMRRGDTELVRTIVELAQNLGLGVIAEGVESATQRDRLLGLGCNLGQGYFFGGPLDPAGAEALLLSRRSGPGSS